MHSYPQLNAWNRSNQVLSIQGPETDKPAFEMMILKVILFSTKTSLLGVTERH